MNTSQMGGLGGEIQKETESRGGWKTRWLAAEKTVSVAKGAQ